MILQLQEEIPNCNRMVTDRLPKLGFQNETKGCRHVGRPLKMAVNSEDT
jgi:hypothetical protein